VSPTTSSLSRRSLPLLTAMLLSIKVALVVVAGVHMSLRSSSELLQAPPHAAGSSDLGSAARSALDRNNQWWPRGYDTGSLENHVGTNMLQLPGMEDGHRRLANGESNAEGWQDTRPSRFAGSSSAPRPAQGSKEFPANVGRDALPKEEDFSKGVQDSQAGGHRPKAFWWAKPIQPAIQEATGEVQPHLQAPLDQASRPQSSRQGKRRRDAEPAQLGKHNFWYEDVNQKPFVSKTDTATESQDDQHRMASDESERAAKGVTSVRQPSLEDIERTVGTNLVFHGVQNEGGVPEVAEQQHSESSNLGGNALVRQQVDIPAGLDKHDSFTQQHGRGQETTGKAYWWTQMSKSHRGDMGIDATARSSGVTTAASGVSARQPTLRDIERTVGTNMVFHGVKNEGGVLAPEDQQSAAGFLQRGAHGVANGIDMPKARPGPGEMERQLGTDTVFRGLHSDGGIMRGRGRREEGLAHTMLADAPEETPPLGDKVLGPKDKERAKRPLSWDKSWWSGHAWFLWAISGPTLTVLIFVLNSLTQVSLITFCSMRHTAERH